MAILEILTFPDPRLRITAKPVDNIDASIQRLLDDMLETMYAERGIGLAAVQVNVPLRVVVMDLSEHRDQPFYLVNPEILYKESIQHVKAGCLSVPETYDTVPYAQKIQFRYLDRTGHTQTLEVENMLAACVQHEIDHLNGVLFIDYLSALKRERILKKLTKHKKLQRL